MDNLQVNMVLKCGCDLRYLMQFSPQRAESWGAFWGWGHAPQMDFASACICVHLRFRYSKEVH